VTVAAVIERGGKFLLVEEETGRGAMFNQPAGHLDPGESLLDAAIRETLEETAHRFQPGALLGVYHYLDPGTGITYVRFAFTGDSTGVDAGRPLDQGIIRAVWMSPEEVRDTAHRHRNPMVMRCMDDYLAGRRYPLDLLTYHAGSVTHGR